MRNRENQNLETPYLLVNWSLLWSPLNDSDAMLAAWENLALPLPLETPLRHAFVKTFQMDLPQPAIPLMFSAALQRDVSACHEEWMRIAGHLALSRLGPTLAPDHLALACELLAHAMGQHDSVLVSGMIGRYFQPWLTMASSRCDGPLRMGVIEPFQKTISMVMDAAPFPATFCMPHRRGVC